MPLTKVETHNIDNYVVTTEKLSNTAVAAFAQTLTPKILTVVETDATYTALDDTAMNTAGGYLVITGSDFQSGASVIIDTTTANSTTFVNTSTLRAQVPAKSAGTYNIYVVNPDGGTAIRVNALTYSAFPAFSTAAALSNQNANAAFGVAISASSDSNITYSNTTSLPAGTTLMSNGWFYGTVTIGVETTYSFTVKATDVELQDTSRTFSLTVIIRPAPGLYFIGGGDYGRSGLSNQFGYSLFTQIGTSTWTSVATNDRSVAAVKTGGSLWVWGFNNAGQLGSNDKVYRSSPIQLGASTNWSLVNGKYYQTIGAGFLAIKTDGTLWTWGSEANGSSGLNVASAYRSSPVQIGALTNWRDVRGNKNSTWAIKTDNTLWAWGLNNVGQSGFVAKTAKSSPVQVGALSNWSKIAPNERLCFAIKTDGTLWAWGDPGRGALGLNNATIYRSSPTQVGTDTNWSQVAAGLSSGFAIKTDGTLWSWGFGQFGQLGDNNGSASNYRSSPAQVGALTNWSKVSASFQNYTAVALKTDGTVWGWGLNTYNSLGGSGGIHRSSPVQIGTDGYWSDIQAGAYHNFAISS
jgi:hypothetical protein